MKRRNGFTLTEILIALVLVGVLSAVAINTLRSRDMSEEFTAKRDKAIMNIQGVIKNTMFNERIEQLASFDDIKDKVNEHLSARADGDNLFMRDGTMYSINTVSDSSSPYVAELVIDTNGNTLPNSFGLDKYKYKLDLGGNLILDKNTDNSNWSGINPPGDIPGGEIPGGGGADPKLPGNNNNDNNCPSGTHWDGSKCTPDEEVPNNECGANEQWNGSKCVPKAPEEPIKMCPPGYISVNGECVVEYRSCAGNEIKVNGICQCIDGYERVNGTCQPIECPEGFELVNGTCILSACAEGYKLVNGKCEPIKCELGYRLVGNTCEPIECDEGYELVNGKCEEVNPCAYLGPTFILKDGICQPYDYCGATAKWDPTTESCVPYNPCKDGYDFVNGSCVKIGGNAEDIFKIEKTGSVRGGLDILYNTQTGEYEISTHLKKLHFSTGSDAKPESVQIIFDGYIDGELVTINYEHTGYVDNYTDKSPRSGYRGFVIGNNPNHNPTTTYKGVTYSAYDHDPTCPKLDYNPPSLPTFYIFIDGYLLLIENYNDTLIASHQINFDVAGYLSPEGEFIDLDVVYRPQSIISSNLTGGYNYNNTATHIYFPTKDTVKDIPQRVWDLVK